MIGLSPLLDRESGVPVYKQLYRYIRGQIESGRMKENDRLPSIRQLSAHLLISKNTVETAYEQLLAEGYVQSKPRSGLIVLPIHPVAGVAEAPDRSLPAPRNAAASETEAAGTVIDFQYGDVALEKFPLASWKKCVTEALAGDRRQVLGYGALQGSGELRREIARYLYAARGILCSPEQIFLAGGTQQAVSLLCQLLLSAEEPFAMEDPGYDGVRTVLANHRMRIVPIPADAEGLDVEALRRSGAKAVYATPAHQFPLGGVMPVGKRSRLLQWADETDGIIVEDDYNSEFRYQGQPIPPLKAMDAGDRVVYLGTFSKSFLPAARLSYLVLPARLSDGFRERLGTYSQSVSPIIQQAAFLFMKEGHYDRHVRKMRKLYQSRNKALIAAIQREMGDRVETIGQKAGLHLLADVRGRDFAELIESASLRGVKVYSPRSHWMNPESCPGSYVMLGFGGVTEEAIVEGVRRLKAAWFGRKGRDDMREERG